MKSDKNEYRTEQDLETAFMQYLIDSKKYCLIKRQFKTSTGNTRLDIICIDHGFQLIIFELKLKLNMSAINQAEAYNSEYLPKASYTVYHNPLSNSMKRKINEYSGDIGIIEYRNKSFNLIREAKMNYVTNLPEFMLLRLNTDYLSDSFITTDNSWFTDSWRKYSIDKMIKMGYNTENYRKKWWLKEPNSKIKPRKNNSTRYMRENHKSLLDY